MKSSASRSASVASSSHRCEGFRYLVTLAQVPDEAFWCSITSFVELRAKIQYTWGIEAPLMTYHLSSVADGVVPKQIHLLDDEDFATWLRRGDADADDVQPLAKRLIVADLHTIVSCMHTSDQAAVQRRPLLESALLCMTGARFALRHSASDGLLLAGATESVCWGNAVNKVRSSWGLHRPVFRYVDEDETGSRCVISIVDADDFSLWRQRRMPVVPELTVFEHAAPQLLAEVRQSRARLTQPIEANPRSPYTEVELASLLKTPDNKPLSMSGTYNSGAITSVTSARTPFAGVKNNASAIELQKAVDGGEYGPTFTTPDSVARSKRKHREDGEKHFTELVKMQNALKM